MGLCYRHEKKLPPPDTIKLNLYFKKQQPLFKQETLSKVFEQNQSYEESNSQDNSQSDDYYNSSNHCSSYPSKNSHYQSSSKYEESSFVSSSQIIENSSCKSKSSQHQQEESSQIIKNKNKKTSDNQNINSQQKQCCFPIHVQEDNNEDIEIENLSDEEAAEYSKASSFYTQTQTQHSRKSIKQQESKADILNPLNPQQQSEEKISRDYSKTLKSNQSGKSLRTFKSLDQIYEKEDDPQETLVKKTIKTIADKAKANQFVIVVTDENSKKDLKYMMVNIKEQNNMEQINMEQIQEDEEEECKIDENDLESKFDKHPIIAKKNNNIKSEELNEIHYETEQTIKTFESFYQTIKQRNTEKLTDTQPTSQKKSQFAKSKGNSISS